MLNLNIPLADHFLEIIKNHEIHNWQAKSFWVIIRQSNQSDPSNFRALREDVYAAIKLLSKNDYLIAQRSPFKKNINLYSEGEKIKELREKLVETVENNPLISKKISTIKELEVINKQMEFIDELIMTCPEFDSHIKKYRKELDSELTFCKIKIRTIDNILKAYSE